MRFCGKVKQRPINRLMIFHFLLHGKIRHRQRYARSFIMNVCVPPFFLRTIRYASHVIVQRCVTLLIVCCIFLISCQSVMSVFCLWHDCLCLFMLEFGLKPVMSYSFVLRKNCFVMNCLSFITILKYMSIPASTLHPTGFQQVQKSKWNHMEAAGWCEINYIKHPLVRSFFTRQTCVSNPRKRNTLTKFLCYYNCVSRKPMVFSRFCSCGPSVSCRGGTHSALPSLSAPSSSSSSSSSSTGFTPG